MRTTHSVISPGTEKMKVEQAKMNLLQKAKARPDQVRKVSPWLFRFYDPANPRLWVVHLVVGLGVLLVTALTQKEPRYLHMGVRGQTPVHT